MASQSSTPDSLDEVRLAADWIEAQIRLLRPLPADHPRLDTFTVCRCTIRTLLPHARAVVILAQNRQGEATGSCVRTMFELWADMRYLLKCSPDPEFTARKLLAYELIEFLDYLRKYPNPSITPEEIAELQASLEQYRSTDPSPVAEVEAQRAARRGAHWSGLRRTDVLDAVFRTLPPTHTELRRAYKLLSWDAHGNMAVTRRAPTWTDPQEWSDDSAKVSAGFAGPILRGSWELFAKEFGLQVRP